MLKYLEGRKSEVHCGQSEPLPRYETATGQNSLKPSHMDDIFFFFYVSLNVHLSINLANDQLDAEIFNTFITILDMYMFRAISCSSS